MMLAARLYRFTILLDKSGSKFDKFCREMMRLPGADCPELESKPLLISDFVDLSATG